MGICTRFFSAFYTFWTLVISVIIPPVGVFLRVGPGKTFLINILLTILGYLPGVIHAIYVMATVPHIGAKHHKI